MDMVDYRWTWWTAQMEMVDYTDGHGGLHRWTWWNTQMDMVDYTMTLWTAEMDMVDY
jgi:hypothetical protein